MVDDSMEVLDEEGDEEAADEEVERVMNELNAETFGASQSAPKTQVAAAAAQEEEEDEETLDQMRARLEQLKGVVARTPASAAPRESGRSQLIPRSPCANSRPLCRVCSVCPLRACARRFQLFGVTLTLFLSPADFSGGNRGCVSVQI
eukprot:6183971-Pleurochrysis_carterae.AAC.7